MPLSPKHIRTQLNLLQPLLRSCSLETIRKGQNKLGELMETKHRRQALAKPHHFDRFQAAWIIPRDERRQGVILYLHGGGYTCGDLEYAKGFGSVLSVQTGTRVFCAAYRLAPEHPYPAALEDALEAYQYLLSKGYAGSHISLCGESAGGGLCYALCLKLRELELPMPGSIVALSPWTDLTLSGDSHTTNRTLDVSLSEDLLRFFADSYTHDFRNPLVSPLFANLEQMPPSLIFAASEEILRSDAEDLHRRLLEAGCKSQLVITPDRWHAYQLYCLPEDQRDFSTICKFLNQYLSQENKLHWLRLDNAAKIYPAARNSNWSNVFRLSATLSEPIDVRVMQQALDITVRRFPSMATRLRRGIFWYYLQQLDRAPSLREESCYPLTKMSREEIRQCALRVIVYGSRVAVEVFHSLTDGNGALVFLKSLVAEYLQQKYGISIPAEQGVLGRLEEPSEEELEDSFLKYAGPDNASRKERSAWRLYGTPEPGDFLHVTCLQIPVQPVLALAHAHKVTLTAFLSAAVMDALQNLQKQQVPNPRWRKPIKILIPVNLRSLFPSRSLRNFALYTTPEIDPRLGEYSFDEICKVVHHHMGMEITPKQMSRKIATNVSSERMFLVKIMPLFLKNTVMKAVFHAVGERKSCLSLSNLGAVRLPEVMQPYVTRMDFILGTQATAPYNIGVLSLGDTLYINLIRNIREPALEYHLHCVLRDMGLPVEVQSNQPQQ